METSVKNYRKTAARSNQFIIQIGTSDIEGDRDDREKMEVWSHLYTVQVNAMTSKFEDYLFGMAIAALEIDLAKERINALMVVEGWPIVTEKRKIKGAWQEHLTSALKGAGNKNGKDSEGDNDN